MKRETT